VADHVRREPIGTNQHGWFAGAGYEVAQEVLTPADLCAHHLIMTPPPARLYVTINRWFSQAGVAPQRLSMCNSLSVTMLTIAGGLGIGLVPESVMRDSLAQGVVKQLDVRPSVPPHQVWICYQVEELGPGLQEVVGMIRQIVSEKGLFA
jgi:DNA-binding transcriptional LysR family regulator